MISLKFKTEDSECDTSDKGCGVFSIGNHGHDRHFGIRKGKIYHRVWKGVGWTADTDIDLNDGQWHQWDLFVMDGKG